MADAAGRVGALFSPPDAAVMRADRALTLYAILAGGVPHIAVEEALWTATALICG